MSCIAVNLNEVKKEVIRIDLKRPILGKDGPKQQGDFFNVDTGAPVKEIFLKRRGLYMIKTVWIGENIQVIVKEGTYPAYITCIEEKVVADGPSFYFVTLLTHVADDNVVFPLRTFVNIPANGRVDHFYSVHIFLDE